MQCTAGARIFSQGERASAIYFVQSGKVKVTVVSAAGKEAVVSIVTPLARGVSSAKRFASTMLLRLSRRQYSASTNHPCCGRFALSRRLRKNSITALLIEIFTWKKIFATGCSTIVRDGLRGFSLSCRR